MRKTSEIRAGDLILLEQYRTEVAEGGTYVGYHPPHFVLKLHVYTEHSISYDCLIGDKLEVIYWPAPRFKKALIFRNSTKYKFEPK